MNGLYDRLTPPDNTTRARSLWDAAAADTEFDGTSAALYLRRPGVAPPWPGALRYLPDAWHGPEATRAPALIAAITDVHGEVAAIQRTYLNDDGDLGDLRPVRLLLGACAGHAIHLGEPRRGQLLIVTEALAGAIRRHHRHATATWAALSAVGIARLTLPAAATDILIVPTSDAGRRAAHRAAERWRTEGRAVRISGELGTMPPRGRP